MKEFYTISKNETAEIIEKKSKKMHFLPRILFSGRLQTEKSKFER